MKFSTRLINIIFPFIFWAPKLQKAGFSSSKREGKIFLGGYEHIWFILHSSLS